jgi:hypothetical protein
MPSRPPEHYAEAERLIAATPETPSRGAVVAHALRDRAALSETHRIVRVTLTPEGRIPREYGGVAQRLAPQAS